MTETFHDLISRSNSINEKTVKKKLKVATVKVISWNSNDGLVVNQYICHEMDATLTNLRQELNRCNESESQNFAVFKHTKCSNENVIVVFDEIGGFEIDNCKCVIGENNHPYFKNVLLLRETDPVRFFITFCKFVREEAVISNHLKLIVVYCSKDSLEKIMKLLKCMREKNVNILVVTSGWWPRTWSIKLQEDGAFVVESSQEASTA